MTPKPQKLLVVDDNLQDQEILRKFFSIDEIDVLAATRGKEALTIAEKEKVDLILLATGLPDIDGFEVCRKFMEHEAISGIPIILMTPRESTSDKVRGFELGAADYVNKPFNLPELRARVQSKLRARRTHEQLAIAPRKERPRTFEDLARIGRAVDSTSDAICIVGPEGETVYQNEAFHTLFEGTQSNTPISQETLFADPNTWDMIWDVCRSAHAWRGEVVMLTPHGRAVPTLCRANSIKTENGKFHGLVLIYTDITQRKRLEQDLIYLANHDPLTNLYNRRHFCEMLEQAVNKARRGTTSILLYLDLDNFKIINDTLGHLAGDRLLLNIANILRGHSRKPDVLARIGGDEFVVLLEDTEATKASLLAEKFIRLFDNLRYIEGNKSLPTSVSIGIAPVDGTVTAEEALAHADAACYQAKSKGRNCFEFYQHGQSELARLSREASWSTRLKDALKHNDLELWLQPVLPLKEGKRAYFEVLLRLKDENGQVALPGLFIPAAERFGNMLQIDQYVIKSALAFLGKNPNVCLAINLSAKTLNEPELSHLIRNLLLEYQVNPANVAFEITETAMIMNMSKVQSLIMSIKSLGCHFALDDFGSGFSSLSYLRDLPVDTLKIDGSFIHNLECDELSQALVRSINDIAHTLSKETVAEFVETPEALQLLRQMGVDYAQGWHLGRPVPLRDFNWEQWERTALEWQKSGSGELISNANLQY